MPPPIIYGLNGKVGMEVEIGAAVEISDSVACGEVGNVNATNITNSAIKLVNYLPKIETAQAVQFVPPLTVLNKIKETGKEKQMTNETDNGIFDDFLPKIDKTFDVSTLAALSNVTNVRKKVKVATLVFLDLETTGLGSSVGKKNVQITEITMIAVARNDFCKSTSADLTDIRVMHKLSLCTRPRCSVSPVAARITGLSNRNLKDEEPFDENTAAVVKGFLSHLQKPVCLLAHNGNQFDFPLLKAEFGNLNIHLPLDCYIVDTLAAFRILGIPGLPFNQALHKNVKFNKNGVISYALQNLHLYFFGGLHAGNHSSEGDCIALAKVCHKMKDKIIPWIEENCCTFDSIKSMW